MENTQKATFAAGCFWGVEARFQDTPGVTATRVGYTGGHTEAPSYKEVCGGNTHHAEAVEVTFDPAQISYEALLDVFWDCHDPTTKDRQGPDIGSQYRSAIFTHDAAQSETASRSLEKQQASGRFLRPIVTEITPAATFWPAEDYHQSYVKKRQGGVTCRQ